MLLSSQYRDWETIKQAIREVLLSDEFLRAFAAAWLKTPILHVDELNFVPNYTQGESK